jgi:hypothetical protein
VVFCFYLLFDLGIWILGFECLASLWLFEQVSQSCGYYRWQRQYLDDLVEGKFVRLFDFENKLEVEEEL